MGTAQHLTLCEIFDPSEFLKWVLSGSYFQLSAEGSTYLSVLNEKGS